MAAKPNIPQLRSQDFPGQQGWIEALLRPFNQWTTQVGAAFTGLRLETNVVAQVEEVRIDTPSDSVERAFPLFFAVKMAAPPRVMMLGRLEDLANGAAIFPSAGPPSWDPTNDGRIKLKFQPGLTVGGRYRATYLVLP